MSITYPKFKILLVRLFILYISFFQNIANTSEILGKEHLLLSMQMANVFYIHDDFDFILTLSSNLDGHIINWDEAKFLVGVYGYDDARNIALKGGQTYYLSTSVGDTPNNFEPVVTGALVEILQASPESHYSESQHVSIATDSTYETAIKLKLWASPLFRDVTPPRFGWHRLQISYRLGNFEDDTLVSYADFEIVPPLDNLERMGATIDYLLRTLETDYADEDDYGVPYEVINDELQKLTQQKFINSVDLDDFNKRVTAAAAYRAWWNSDQSDKATEVCTDWPASPYTAEQCAEFFKNN